MAAASHSPRKAPVYYDTLTELNEDAEHLIEHDFDVPVSDSLIARIFANNKSLHQLRPPQGNRPILLITAGSPGVGKSTKAKEQFERFGVDPEKVYTVSMDTLLEHNRLFRTETKQLYENMLHMKGKPFENENYATFSGISTAAYAAKQANLKVPEKASEVRTKLTARFALAKHKNQELANKLSALKLNESPKKQMGAGTPPSSPQASPRLRRSTRAKKPVAPVEENSSNNLLPKISRTRVSTRKAKKTSSPSDVDLAPAKLISTLDDMRNVGFEYGVKHGLNILYDCTLSKDRMNIIMSTLRKYKENPKYEIKVLLIKADDNTNQAVQKVQSRIMGRHLKMAENGFLRALTTNPKVIKSMIDSNKKGYNSARNTYKNSGNAANSNSNRYTGADFYFEEILNP